MIWSAFLILNMLINTGAMDKIKEIIANLTLDKRKQFIIIAFCFGGFLEGVAGAGTPAAIAAPFLVALGIPPVFAIVGALVFKDIYPEQHRKFLRNLRSCQGHNFAVTYFYTISI